MSEQISDSELLELNTDNTGENEETTEMTISPLTHWQDTQQESRDEDHKRRTPSQTSPLRKKADKRSREKNHQTRRNLRDLNRKLEKIHQHLARTQPPHYQNRSLQKTRPIINPQRPRQSMLTFELTPTMNRLAFRIFDTENIKWIHTEQKIILKTPKRYVAASLWRDANGQPVQRQTQARDLMKFIHIPGIRAFHNQGMQFYFKPTRIYRDVLLENFAIVSEGIRLRLSRVAASQRIVIPKSVYIGELNIINNLHKLVLKPPQKQSSIPY